MQLNLKYILITIFILIIAASMFLPGLIEDRSTKRITMLALIPISFFSLFAAIWYKEKIKHEKINYKMLFYFSLIGLIIMLLIQLYLINK